jgi:adenylate cyclase
MLFRNGALRMDEGKRRLAGILAADVVGYSAMVGADEPGTLARVRALRTDVIEPLVAAHEGRLFKTTGDGFFVEFASAVQALRCAIAIQDTLRAEVDGLRLRIGVHQGEVVPEGDDLMGDGVIIAARLEPLAEPGGICISSRVREDATGKIALEVDDLGEPALKNIAAKIKVFRARLSVSERPALPLPDKPSLVVLPFRNMSGDPEQEYFSDGMAEDITTALSRIRSLFVIARNSAFAYKGTSPDIRKVGRELGVRYVLEGSVRKSGGRVRITAQLIEAASGSHIWADRYDGILDDVFDLQDRITASVVAKIAPMVRNAEIQRAQRAPTNNPQAYDLLLRALSHYRNWTRAGYEEAVRLLRQAITIDPGYALGYAHLSAILVMMCSQGWVVDRADPTVADMLGLARTALTLDGEDPEVLIMVGSITALQGGDFSGGIAMVNKAIALNPNSAVAFRTAGGLYARAGDATRAFASYERAERLDPFDSGPSDYSGQIIAHFVTGAYDDALECCDKSLRDRPRSAAGLRYRAACLGLLGRLEEARQTVQRLRELVPDFTVARARHHIEFDMNNLFGKPSDREAFYEGLRRAGVPE